MTKLFNHQSIFPISLIRLTSKTDQSLGFQQTKKERQKDWSMKLSAYQPFQIFGVFSISHQIHTFLLPYHIYLSQRIIQSKKIIQIYNVSGIYASTHMSIVDILSNVSFLFHYSKYQLVFTNDYFLFIYEFLAKKRSITSFFDKM